MGPCGYIYDTDTNLYYLQSRYYDPELGRFINADAFTSTGQGLLGNNMFAYCNNNPANNYDSTGELPVWFAASIGGAVGGALLNVTLYLTAEEDSATLGGALYAMGMGAVSGALGGAAGMSSKGVKAACITGAGLVSGIYAACTGGSFTVGFAAGLSSAYGGTLFSDCGFLGFDLAFVNYMTTILTGLGAEGISQMTYVSVEGENSSSQTTSTPNRGEIRKRPRSYIAIPIE